MKKVDYTNFGSLTSVGTGGVSVTKFWASWCAPCKALDPKFNELELKSTEGVKFFSFQIDASDENIEFAKSLGIKTVPTTLVEALTKTTFVSGVDIRAIEKAIDELRGGAVASSSAS